MSRSLKKEWAQQSQNDDRDARRAKEEEERAAREAAREAERAERAKQWEAPPRWDAGRDRNGVSDYVKDYLSKKK